MLMQNSKLFDNMKRTKFLFLISIIVFLSLSKAENIAAQAIKTVVLDAGHGGRDPGNLGTGRYKTTEKDIAL